MKDRRMNWQAPVSMLVFLACAGALAIGHHFFYRSLEGQPVSNGSVFGSPISKQQANISVGLAFAFVIKASLVFAMSLAFSQLFWREATGPSSPPTLARLDAMHSAFDNIISLLKVKYLWRHPLIPIVGFTAWLIPLASIIAPATLSIQMAAVTPTPSKLLRVPNLDFRSMVFTASLPQLFDFRGTATIGTYRYNGPSQGVAEITNAVMAQGQLAFINPPAPNSSWTINLAGPYIKCNNVDQDLHQQIRRNIMMGMVDDINANLYAYLSWLPQTGWTGAGMDSDLPFLAKTDNGTMKFGPGLFPGETSSNNITFYVVSMPSLFDINQTEVTRTFNQWYNNTHLPTPEWVEGTMLECVLLNATYHASFRYVEGVQHIDIEADATSDQTIPITQVLGPVSASSNDECLNPTTITGDQKKDCYNNADVMRRLSYQSIVDAFTANMLGSISFDGFQTLQRASGVLNTALIDTQELSFLRTKAASMDTKNQTLQQIVASSHEQALVGLTNSNDTVSKLSLAKAIEQMFQNVTISQMSSSLLQPNYSSISAPSAVNVTLPQYQNIYIYSAIKLWAAYGVAIFLAALAVLLGLVTIFLNGVSYGNSFSTIFRAAKGATISERLTDRDVIGEDPLPKRLATAQVSFMYPDKDEKLLDQVRGR